jgi:outer membrane protein assembly factor BamB
VGRRRALAAAAVTLSLLFSFQPVLAGLGVISGAYWSATVVGDLNAMVVADLNHDGWSEILGGTDEGQVVVWAAGGQPFWEFQVESDWVTSISTADLDADGSEEVLVIAAGILPTNYLYVLRADGSLWWSYSVRDDLWLVLPFNLDEDPEQELLLAARRPRILDTDGAEIPDWPENLLRTPYVHVIDWDGDNSQEVLSLTSDSMNIIEADGTSRSFPISLPGDIMAVEVGDVGGDGESELAVLTGTALVLLKGDSSIQWIWPLFGSPRGLRMIMKPPNAEKRIWVVISDESGIIALDENGQEQWGFDAKLPGDQTFVLASHEDLLLVGTSAGQVYLLNGQGYQLAEYDLVTPVSRAQIFDLNGDGHLEILLNTGGSIYVFGMSVGGREIRARWSYTASAPLVSLDFTDVDGDRRAEVFLGERDGRITVLDRKGALVWQHYNEEPLKGWVKDDFGGLLTWVGASFYRYNGQGNILWEAQTSGKIQAITPAFGEIAVLTENSRVTLHSMEDGRSIWTIDLNSPGFDLLVTGEGLIVSQEGAVILLDANGMPLWRTEFNHPVLEVSVAPDEGILIRSPGDLTRLNAAGGIRWIWKTQPAERITGVDISHNLIAVGTDARAITLDRLGVEVWSQSLEEVVSGVAIVDVDSDGIEEISFGTVRGSVVLLSSQGDEIWRDKGRERVNVLETADINADGLPEILVGFEDGVVTAYGFALDQPPFLGDPTITAIGNGYQYAVRVHDPEVEPVSVTAEIWVPSESDWISLGSTTASAGEGVLTWNVPNPFNTWDSGKDSAFRFVWDDGQEMGTVAALTGPLHIPVAPWYLTYGRMAGLAVLIFSAPVLLAFIIHRTRRHRRSPLGLAEAALLRLLLDPDMTVLEFHRLLSDEDQALALLEHMPGLAREAGEAALGDLLEGAHLALTRPDVMAEALRTIMSSLQRLEKLPQAEESRQFYTLLYKALTVTSISQVVELRTELDKMSESLNSNEFIQIPTTVEPKQLASVARTLRASEQVDSTSDRIAYLAEALADLSKLDRDIKEEPGSLEGQAIAIVIHHWLELITETLEKLRGRAEFELKLRTRQLVLQKEVILGITLTNTGRSPATDLAVEVITGGGLEPLPEPTLIDLLSPGASRQLELTLQSIGKVGTFNITIRVTWDDRERAEKESLFPEQVRLIPKPSQFQPIPNPYATGRPLNPDSPVFVGREDIFDFVKKNIAGGHIVVLVGERRTGKSSILRQLSTRMGDDWVVAYLDGQGLGLAGGLENWLADAALEISRATGFNISPSPSELGSQPGPAFETFLQQVRHGLNDGRRLLLLFDEFEEIEARVRDGDLPPSIFPYLRHLMQFGEAGFLLAGTKCLESLSPKYWTPLFNIGLYREVPPLDDASARRLIQTPVEGRLLYDDLAVDKLLRLSGRQPYFLQLLCYSLVSHCNRERISYVTSAEVGKAEDEASMMGQAHLRFLWESLSPEEQAALTALAWLISRGDLGTIEAISARLRSLGRHQEIKCLPESLLQLKKLDLVTESLEKRYQFTADLVRSWITHRKM